MTKFDRNSYTKIGGTTLLVDDGTYLNVRVYLGNEQGERVMVNAHGKTTDDAIRDAIDFAHRNHDRPGVVNTWQADEWETA